MYADVKICWSDWKRALLPEGTYSTVAKFEDDKFPAEAWSVRIQISSRLGENEWLGRVEFLSPDAPPDLLRSGAKFELMEGIRSAGRVTVL
jgi:hypothetical protein